ncbi:hypothetical protein KIN20_029357 [Parelaphostrongylus tenuis]|uniref:Uncharacterized protein n=1 Tax=Parelaphostrongylus tenuis TaxID=148309 RepID=A0AAD5R2A1_PARTN|nr:hypothetical protein KIN20_029357 [Parelaphostrongylus tenuis]
MMNAKMAEVGWVMSNLLHVVILMVIFCELTTDSSASVNMELSLRSEKTVAQTFDFMKRASRQKRQLLTTMAPQIPSLFDPLTILNQPIVINITKKIATALLRNLGDQLHGRPSTLPPCCYRPWLYANLPFGGALGNIGLGR